MTSLLSILVCLAMLFTGSPEALEPDAVISRTLSVYDVSLRVKGEDYPITAGLKLGIAEEDGAVLLDGCVTRGEDKLFPLQARASEDGVALLVGDPGQGYMLTGALFDGDFAAISQFQPVIDAYREYMRAALVLSQALRDDATVAEVNEQLGERFDALLEGDAETEVTFSLEDVDYADGIHVHSTIDNDGFRALMDYATEEIEPLSDFMQAYVGYMNAVMDTTALLGGEAQGEALPEFEHLSELYDSLGVSLAADIDYTGLEDYSKGYMHIDITMTVPDTDEAVDDAEADDDADDTEAVEHTIVIPMDITIYDGEANRLDMKANIDIAELEMNMTLESAVNGKDITEAAYITGADTYSGAYLNMNLTSEHHEEGLEGGQADSVEMSAHVETYESGTYDIGLNIDQTTSPDNTIDGAFAAAVTDGEKLDVALTFSYRAMDEAIEDRTASAEMQPITSLEELNKSSLIDALADMLQDSEKLMSDGSILAAVNAINEMNSAEAAPAGGAADDAEPADEVAERAADDAETGDELPMDDAADGDWDALMSMDPADLSFAVPSLNGLPEGYELDSYYADPYFDYILLRYTKADDPEAPELSVTIQPSEADDFVLDENGELVQNTARKISIQNAEDGSTQVTGTLEGMSVMLFSTSALEKDDIVAFYNGIDFNEPMALEYVPSDEESQALGMDDPETLPFAIPAITWMPEGYELLGQYVYSSFDMVVLVYGDLSDTSRPLLNVEFDAVDEASRILGEDAGAPVIAMDRNEADKYTTAALTNGDLCVTLYAYDVLDDETIAAFFSGIDYKAEQELLPADWDESVLDPWYVTEVAETTQDEAEAEIAAAETAAEEAFYSTDDPAALSFEVPAFGWLPEGYELTESYYYQEYDIAALVYANPEAPEAPAWCVQVSPKTSDYYTLEDGALVPMQAPLPLTVTGYETWTQTWQTVGDLDIVIDAEGVVSDEDILAFYNAVGAGEEAAA